MKTLAILTYRDSSLWPAIKSIRDDALRHGFQKIYEIRGGYSGLIEGLIVDITHSIVDAGASSYPGSLPTSVINERVVEAMAQRLEDYGVDVLVAVGGTDTVRATEMFREWLKTEQASGRFQPLRLVGLLDTDVDPSLVGLHIEIPLPELFPVDDYLNIVVASISAINLMYSVVALVNYGNPEILKRLLAFFKRRKDPTTISSSSLVHFLADASIRPLRLISFRYGSPATFDLLGLGTALDVIFKSWQSISNVHKDLTWRGKHEKELAKRELESKDLQLEKDKLEIEKEKAELATREAQHDRENKKASLEVISQALELVERILRLPDDQRKLIFPVIEAQIIALANNPIVSLSLIERKSSVSSVIDRILLE